MIDKLPTVDLIVLQDLAKASCAKRADEAVLRRLAEKGLARKVADDWCITLRGRYSLSRWGQDNTFI